MENLAPELAAERTFHHGGRSRFSLFLFLTLLLIGLIYHAVLIFSEFLQPYRFPIPYAVPIFDTPFVLFGIAIGYLCLERHRLRPELRFALLGNGLWLASLLALAHVLAQPDYPGTPGMRAGVAPYFFFLSYLTGFASILLAMLSGDRQLNLSDKARAWIAIGVVGLSVLLVMGILKIEPLLPSMAMKPGRMTPFAIWFAGVSNGLFGAWAIWCGTRNFWGKKQDWFSGFLLVAALVWLIGLVGFLLFPFRYSVSWYVAGLARPLGVIAIFLGLFQEQVWLYREARARQRDLESLHMAGQALAMTLHQQEIVDIIATKAQELSGAEGAVLFRLDPRTQLLSPVSHAGLSDQELVPGRAQQGADLAQRAIEKRQPVSSALDLIERKTGLVVPLLMDGGEIFGAILVTYDRGREIRAADTELLSAFQTQASVALQNARLYGEMAQLAADLAKSNKVKNEFLSVMSHELRTPLSAIVGYTAMIKDRLCGEINPDQNKVLEKIVRRTKDLLTMIESILMATQMEANQTRIEIREISLRSFLNDLRSSYEVLLDKELTLKWDCPSNLPVIRADEDKLRQVLQNLINNGIKFADRGYVAISARYLPGEKSVQFTVADTGIGIPEEALPFVFEKFRQLDSSETRVHGGVGLGLYIVKQLTDKLGGKIHVKSRVGEGTTFTVSFPVEPALEWPAPGPHAAA